jgi:hypothetical protein
MNPAAAPCAGEVREGRALSEAECDTGPLAPGCPGPLATGQPRDAKVSLPAFSVSVP